MLTFNDIFSADLVDFISFLGWLPHLLSLFVSLYEIIIEKFVRNNENGFVLKKSPIPTSNNLGGNGKERLLLNVWDFSIRK